jgi:trimethylamine corrinoid protein
MSLDNVLAEFKKAFYAQDLEKSQELVQKSLDAGADPVDLLEKHILAWAKEFAGRTGFSTDQKVATWKDGEAVSISDLIAMGEVLTTCVNILKPSLAKQAKKVEFAGTIVIGTVEGDVHDIGKTLVGEMLSVAGYKVIDLGYDVPGDRFISTAKVNKADIIALSTSIAMAREVVPQVVKKLKKMGLRDSFSILTGGQASFPNDIELYGVDAHGTEIGEALEKSEELIRIKREKNKKW